MKSIYLFFLLSVFLTGCYQMHSDDDLRTVPTTNNHTLIHDSQRAGSVPGVAY